VQVQGALDEWASTAVSQYAGSILLSLDCCWYVVDLPLLFTRPSIDGHSAARQSGIEMEVLRSMLAVQSAFLQVTI
jgi:hypothetical protein